MENKLIEWLEACKNIEINYIILCKSDTVIYFSGWGSQLKIIQLLVFGFFFFETDFMHKPVKHIYSMRFWKIQMHEISIIKCSSVTRQRNNKEFYDFYATYIPVKISKS